VPEQFGQLKVGVVVVGWRFKKNHAKAPKIININNPGINQPPMCHPPHVKPDPQNIFVAPFLINICRSDHGIVVNWNSLNSDARGPAKDPNAPNDHKRTAATMRRLKQR